MNDQNPEIMAGKARADAEIARWSDDQTPIEFVSIDLSATAWTHDLNLTECLPTQHDFESDARRLHRKIDRSIKASAKEAYDAVVAKIVELEGPDAIKSMPAYNCTMTEAGQEPVALNLIEGVQMLGPNEVFVVLLESLGLRFLGEGIRLRPEDTAEGYARALIAAARRVSE